MKVLIITQYYWPENFRVNDMVSGFVEGGHEATVLTAFPSYPHGKIFKPYKSWQLFKREMHKGARVVRVWSFLDHSLSTIKRILNYSTFAFMASLLGPLLCGLKFDRIVVFQPGPFSVAVPALLLKALMRVPALIWVQDIWPDAVRDSGLVKSEKLLRAVWRCARFIYLRFDRIFISSPGFERYLTDMGVNRDIIDFLPQWSEELYKIENADECLRSREGLRDKFTIMFAGNIGVAQNLEVVLDVAEQLKENADILFYILGDGVRLAPLIQESTKRGLTNVVFKGRKPPDQVPMYFALADALLVQLKRSPAYDLTVPGKLQSYLACGKPVVAALGGAGAQIVVEAGGGVVCEPGNLQELKRAILFLYGLSSEERKKMGLAGKAYYDRNFARPVVMGRLLEAING